MTDQAVQIIARGPRKEAESAAAAIDADPAAETVTYSILEEDEDRDVWRIDAFPTSDDEARAVEAVLARFPKLRVAVETLAAMCAAGRSRFPSVRLPPRVLAGGTCPVPASFHPEFTGV
mgnify:CR=1 FL=1